MSETSLPAGRGTPLGTRPEVSDFLTCLIQALLRTGYYTPDHPESHKAKSDLYETFVRLSGETRGLTLFVRETPEGTEIFVDGILETGLPLDQVMRQGMADLYNEKLTGFLARKEILSLTLGAGLSPEEFSSLVDVLSDPGFGDMRTLEAKQALTFTLIEKGVYHFSIVFREDLITPDRNIPWRAALALSRLRKDLSNLPLFRNLRPDELRDVKRKVIADVLRPLTDPQLAYGILMNIDLACLGDQDAAEGEGEVLNVIENQTLLEVTRLYTLDVTGREEQYRGHLPPEKLGRLLDELARRLIRLGTPRAWRRLNEMFEAGFLSSADLSSEVQRAALAMRVAGHIANDSQRFFEQLNAEPRCSAAMVLVSHLDMVLSCLLTQGKFAELSGTIEEMISWCGRPERPPAIWRSLARIPGSGLLEEGADVFLEAPRERRSDLARFFLVLGEWSIPALVSILQRTRGPWNGREVAEITLQVHQKGAAALLGELEKRYLEPGIQAALLRVLCGVRDPELMARIEKTALHMAGDDRAEIRREAIAALWHFSPAKHLELFERAAIDPDPAIRKNAVRGLGYSGHPDAWAWLRDMAEAVQDSRHEETVETAVTALIALSCYVERCSVRRPAVSEWAVEQADRLYSGGKFKRLLRWHNRPPSTYVTELGRLLGQIGESAAWERLERMTADKDEQVRSSAENLLRRRAA